MIEFRRSADRGHADHGWLQTWHSFSFADHYDPRHMQFGPLRVINDDRIAPQTGFGTHGHRDMEIITYVLAGELTHQDSLGHGGVLHPGDVQHMTAGHGVRHSEFNHHASQSVHLLQIWVQPAQQGLPPGYAQRHFTAADKRGKLLLLASGDGRAGALKVQQDMALYAGCFTGAEQATLLIAPGRRAYVHVARGQISVNGTTLAGGDAAKLSGEAAVTLSGGQDSEVLVFDLP
jgi:redox-sensitive bicupin YhaK (pirin superfamily)